MQNSTNRLNNLLGSDRFFVLVVALLIVQAVWIALSARYPMAFDENFHFGIIKLYGGQWSPFFTQTPPGSGVYGALIRDPSYLYHYLMSFPFRLVAFATGNETAQIITLRLINVALFAAGLIAFKRLLGRLGVSDRLANLSLLMLVFIPVVPFLAAHINYDNLLFLLLPLTISLAFTCGQALPRHARVPVKPFFGLVILSLLTTIVKYVFLPVLLAIGLYLLVIFWCQPKKQGVLRRFFEDFRKLRPLVQAGLIAGLIVSGGLFIERDVVNVVKYGSPSPSCQKVESIKHCMNFGPWARDYDYSQKIASGAWQKPDPNPFSYGADWVRDLLYRLYFAINYNYFDKPPLAVPFYGSMTIGIVGCLLFIYYGRRILIRYNRLLLPLMAVLFYTAAVFYTNYTAYLNYSVRVAVNGRYFIPVLPFIFVFIGLAYRQLFLPIRHLWRRYAAMAFALFVIFMTVQGGGLLTFLVRSEADWYWQNQTVINVNRTAQRLVTPFIVGLD